MIEEIKNELNQTALWLHRIDKSQLNGGIESAPKGYFDTMEDDFMAKVLKPTFVEKTLVPTSVFARVSYRYMAAASLAILFMSGIGYMIYNSAYVQDIQNEKMIYAYLESQIDELDEEELINAVHANEKHTEYKQMEDSIEQFSEEEIKKYLMEAEGIDIHSNQKL